MLLKELVKDCQCIASGNTDVEITALVYDSRRIEKGCMFVCVAGANFDGHDAAKDAIAKGAAAVVIEKEIDGLEGCAIVRVRNTRLALAQLSSTWFGNPASKLKTIGITGTKGKTTTTYLVRSILENSGIKCGLIGTIEIIIGDEHIHSVNTTPESYLVQEYFRKMVDAGLDAVVMEVSSQALMLHRVGGFVFDIGIFTNIEPDHIGPNEHADFDDYLNCKSKLFTMCKKGIANGDDKHTAAVMENRTCELMTYGFGENNDLRAADFRLMNKPGELGVEFNAVTLDYTIGVDIPTPGRFSVYNALAAIAICKELGVADDIIAGALKSAHVKGRIEMVPVSDKFTIMVDYAHNAMALESLLTTLKEYKPTRLVTLFGCGGNRSRDRRFEMGKVSGKLSDLTIITSDNPRFEEPKDIIADIITGITPTGGKYETVIDRYEAIKYAMENALDGDLIVVAGKGHEDYQEIKGVKYPMDDVTMIKDAAKEIGLN